MIFTSPFPELTIPEQSVAQFVLSHAATFGNKPALIDGTTGRTISYAKLAGMSHLLAAGLQQRGLQKGDVLAIYLPNLPEFAVAFYGVQLAGGIATTVNPLYTPHELIHQLRDTRTRYLLTIPPFLPNAIAAAGEAFVEEIFVLGEAEGATPFAALFQNNGQLAPVAINPREDVAAILYSSGTTGLPKGVMLTHHNLVANTLQSNSATSRIITANDVVLAIAPFFHHGNEHSHECGPHHRLHPHHHAPLRFAAVFRANSKPPRHLFHCCSSHCAGTCQTPAGRQL